MHLKLLNYLLIANFLFLGLIPLTALHNCHSCNNSLEQDFHQDAELCCDTILAVFLNSSPNLKQNQFFQSNPVLIGFKPAIIFQSLQFVYQQNLELKLAISLGFLKTIRLLI